MTAPHDGSQMLGDLNFLISKKATAATEKESAQFQSLDQGQHYSCVGCEWAVRAHESDGRQRREDLVMAPFGSRREDDEEKGQVDMPAFNVHTHPWSDYSEGEERPTTRRRLNRILTLELKTATEGLKTQLKSSVYADFLATGVTEVASRAPRLRRRRRHVVSATERARASGSSAAADDGGGAAAGVYQRN